VLDLPKLTLDQSHFAFTDAKETKSINSIIIFFILILS